MRKSDYIIIGAGSAGCVLANRLTEDGDTTVLLLEAGGPDRKPAIHVPGAWKTLLTTELDWTNRTEPQVHLNNRIVTWNRGKVLGGTSSINGMVYIRGHRWDYDRWAELGNEEWSYDEILPYFKKSQNQERGGSDYHGVDGALNVSDTIFSPEIAQMVERFIAAGEELGWPRNLDFNGETQVGFGQYQSTIKDGERHSAAAAWLNPALARQNLTIETHAQVLRILFKGTQAIGVEYAHGNQIKQAFVSQEVIVSSGAINSPQLLLCSGIGPAEQLKAFDIPVIVDLLGVGNNLQDHPSLVMLYTTTPSIKITDLQLEAAEQEYGRSKTGWLAGGLMGGAFVKTQPGLALPDTQLYAFPREADEAGDMGISLSLLRPKGRGTIRLRSTNPLDQPLIQPNYLEHNEDLQSFIDGVKFIRRLTKTDAFAGYVKHELLPGVNVPSDEEILNFIQEKLETTRHFAGTCKMGVDPMAVVNSQLQVHGVTGLRVVDASVMPEVIGGNTNAPVIMIAEKASDMIKAQQALI